MANQKSEGVSMLNISEAAENLGMHTVGAKIKYDRLADDIPLPGIAHWNENHFVVVYEADNQSVTIGNPASDGIMTVPVATFLSGWVSDPNGTDREGILLLMEPTADFFSKEIKVEDRSSPFFIWKNVRKNRKLLWFLGIGIVVGAVLAITFPFILQLAVDESIEHQNTSLLNLILLAWVTLFASQLGLDFIRRFILFHLGTRVNIQLLTDFMIKTLQLPVSFFQSRKTDDVMQTLYDNPRVQRFFTKDAVSLLYATLCLLLFSLALLSFDWKVFSVFLIATAVQALYILFFINRRRALNDDRYELAAAHYSKLTDLIRGIKDIKLANAERTQRWAWERSEAKLYQISRAYTLSDELSVQVPFFLGELRNILIIYLAANAVIEGKLTVGVLVAIIFIITQLNNPIRQLIEFFLGWQETKHSLDRMSEVHFYDNSLASSKIDVLPDRGELAGENLSFRYEGEHSPWVFRNLDFQLPNGKITLIVGANGSGKSTLLNLMLNFVQPQEGIIKLGDVRLSDIQHSTWLSKCGVVPQDGHLFYDTIARNIALGDEVVDNQRLLDAARIANILPFVERLNNGFRTMIGEGGVGLSKAQRQGILIARAVYKQPDFLFLDEATNDLDPENEMTVLDRIGEAFRGKTIVLTASRVSLPIDYEHVIELSPHHVKKNKPSFLASYQGGNGDGLPDDLEEKLFLNL